MLVVFHGGGGGHVLVVCCRVVHSTACPGAQCVTCHYMPCSISCRREWLSGVMSTHSDICMDLTNLPICRDNTGAQAQHTSTSQVEHEQRSTSRSRDRALRCSPDGQGCPGDSKQEVVDQNLNPSRPGSNYRTSPGQQTSVQSIPAVQSRHLGQILDEESTQHSEEDCQDCTGPQGLPKKGSKANKRQRAGSSTHPIDGNEPQHVSAQQGKRARM